MKSTFSFPVISKFLLSGLLALVLSSGFAQSTNLTIDWSKQVFESRTTPTLQVVGNPMLKRKSPIHGGSFEGLKTLGADYVRFVPWFPYPHMAVVELKAPTKTETFYDFTDADQIMEDFMKAQEGHSVVINFSTIPVWMYKLSSPVDVPADPDEVFWGYNQGTELRDTTAKEVAEYFGRLLSWYTKGGFTDELGKFHKSGHFYKIPYWEVLNEADLEHDMTPRTYCKIYDAIVAKFKTIAPEMKCIGLGLAFETNPEHFEYFLNPKNHLPGTPLWGISYHFYAEPEKRGDRLEDYQYKLFSEARHFMDRVSYVENIRKRLSPETKTFVNELGVILGVNDSAVVRLPVQYWNLAGAIYAWSFLELARKGIEVVGASQLVGFPSQFPDVSMMNWTNGKPNARLWVLKLLIDNFGPGDKAVATTIENRQLAAQAFTTAKGKKLLLINTRNTEATVSLPESSIAKSAMTVDETTFESPAAATAVTGNKVVMKPFAVTVVNF